MVDEPAIAQQGLSTVDRGSSPAYPLGPETIRLASEMSARMLQGLIAVTPGEITTVWAAKVAVEMTFHVVNEIREYKLIDNKIVKTDTEVVV
jgi:hypothetical protein